jgi:hypothetical protein
MNPERWQSWQLEHTGAFAALQEAQRAYHRTVADGAFQQSENRSPTEHQRDALAALDVARKRLDEVRARKPEEPV